jgi:monoamine oxidase
MKNNYAILGLSLAGAAAAMKLSATGAEVRVFELLDDVPLRAWNRVGIGSRSEPGSVVEPELLANLKTAVCPPYILSPIYSSLRNSRIPVLNKSTR